MRGEAFFDVSNTRPQLCVWIVFLVVVDDDGDDDDG
jgi:hypothetical protein